MEETSLRTPSYRSGHQTQETENTLLLIDILGIIWNTSKPCLLFKYVSDCHKFFFCMKIKSTEIHPCFLVNYLILWNPQTLPPKNWLFGQMYKWKEDIESSGSQTHCNKSRSRDYLTLSLISVSLTLSLAKTQGYMHVRLNQRFIH